MFASTPKTERPITPYLDPDASKKLQQLFFGNKDEGPKRSLKQMRAWANKASLPKARTIEGVGEISFSHNNKRLVRHVTRARSRNVRKNGKVLKRVEKETLTFDGSTSRTLPMKYQHLHVDSVANETWKNVDIPDKVTKEVTEVDIGCDYVDGVDKIAIPPGFITLKTEPGLQKSDIKEKFSERVVIRPTKTIKKGDKIERVEGDFLIKAIDYQERLEKRVKVIRPKSAPIRNIKKSQRAARDALSTPSRFARLGEKYVDRNHDWMTKNFPNKRIFKMVKQLPGESLTSKSDRIVDVDYLTYNAEDPELYEWCIEMGDENVKKLKYNPDGTLKLKPPKYYKRAILEPGKEDLLTYERAEYAQEKFSQLSIPKRRWDSNATTEYFRNQNDELVKTVVKRDKGKNILKHRREVIEEIAEIKSKTGAKVQSQYAIENTGKFRTYSEAKRAGF
ncbi:hypothetical protein TrVE_jg8605 [Triparma verrucosa]|uniref:Uncharacterized protein n=1 Tax=Triparma verrucosa TaxID=1606542 RepID=A0A9W7FGE4_9STRA|nr:hypothetical protein TrVE_jg8605 [Triparma verrucosa]